MSPFSIVLYLDVLKDFSLRIHLIFEGTVLKQLGLEATEAGLHKSFIIGNSTVLLNSNS